ncbi:MAG: hypothetical protein K6E60_05815 [Saccharofermentans sp.]|nr:hypothetical protein [Saccharofermentans sp.]
MKKIVTKLLCGVLLSSVLFSGCNQVTETTTSETESQAEATATETEPAPVETTARPEINADNMKKVADLYASKEPEGKNPVYVFADGVRGSGSYFVDNGTLYFTYLLNNETTFQVLLQSGKRTADIHFDIIYKEDQRLYGSGDAVIDNIEKIIDDLIEDTAAYITYSNRSAYVDHKEDIKKDLPVLYSRFIKIADNAFPELGLKLEDLGSKYRTVDHTQLMSLDRVVTKTLDYKNGISTQGKKLWTDYFYNAVGVMGNMTRKDWRWTSGQNSSSMLKSGDYVQYVAGYGRGVAAKKKYAELFYVSPKDNDNDESEQFMVNIDDASTKKTKQISVTMTYRLMMKDISIGKGSVVSKYQYWVSIKAKPGQYDKVFESKESLKKYAKVNLYITNKKGVGSNAWGKKANIDKLKKQFEADGCTYYTKDQVIDKLWEHHENFLASLDYGMSGMDTSLADIGVNWKK